MVKVFWDICDLQTPAWSFLSKHSFYSRCGNTCAHHKYDLSYFNSQFQSEVSFGQKTVATNSHSVHVYNVAADKRIATSRAPPGSSWNQGSACLQAAACVHQACVL